MYEFDKKTNEPKLKRPNHFKSKDRDEFVRDFMCPFFRKYAAAIRSEIPEAIMFCEPVINFEDLHGDPPPRWIDDKDVGYVFFFEFTLKSPQ